MQRHHVIESVMILMESEDKNKLFFIRLSKTKKMILRTFMIELDNN